MMQGHKIARITQCFGLERLGRLRLGRLGAAAGGRRRLALGAAAREEPVHRRSLPA